MNGTISGVGATPALTVQYIKGPDPSFDISIYIAPGGNSFVGTVQLEKSIDGGTTFLPLIITGNQTHTWNINIPTPTTTVPVCIEQSTLTGGAIGAQYRLNCTQWTSGQLNYVLLQ